MLSQPDHNHFRRKMSGQSSSLLLTPKGENTKRWHNSEKSHVPLITRQESGIPG